MFEQDYLMRIIAQLLGAIRRSMERAAGEEDPDGAARALDMALGDATDLDGEALLSLAPESLASVLQVSGVDPHLTEYIARSLMLSGRAPRVAPLPPPSGMSWDPTPSATRLWRRLLPQVMEKRKFPEEIGRS